MVTCQDLINSKKGLQRPNSRFVDRLDPNLLKKQTNNIYNSCTWLDSIGDEIALKKMLHSFTRFLAKGNVFNYGNSPDELNHAESLSLAG